MSPICRVRMGLYRRIGALANQAEIDAFAAELIDRFGTRRGGRVPTEDRGAELLVRRPASRRSMRAKRQWC